MKNFLVSLVFLFLLPTLYAQNSAQIRIADSDIVSDSFIFTIEYIEDPGNWQETSFVGDTIYLHTYPIQKYVITAQGTIGVATADVGGFTDSLVAPPVGTLGIILGPVPTTVPFMSALPSDFVQKMDRYFKGRQIPVEQLWRNAANVGDVVQLVSFGSWQPQKIKPQTFHQDGATTGQYLRWSSSGIWRGEDLPPAWQRRESFCEYFGYVSACAGWESAISGGSQSVTATDFEDAYPAAGALTVNSIAVAGYSLMQYGSTNQSIHPVVGSCFRTLVKIPTIPAISTDSLIFRFGFFPRVTMQGSTVATRKGAYFDYRYQHDASEYRLKAITSTGDGVSQTTSTVITGVAFSGWMSFEVKRDADGVKFYINDALVATHTTNFPTTTSATRIFPGVGIQKCAGAVAAGYKMIGDYLYYKPL
jgi:hypothetical protein